MSDQLDLDQVERVTAGSYRNSASWLPEVISYARLLKRRLDYADEKLRIVVSNHSNHYDWYWTKPPEPITDEWLAETKAKMEEALTDAFCDDAAFIMLRLIAEIYRLREGRVKLAALRELRERKA